MKTRMSIILAAITMILLISAPAFCEENSTMDVTVFLWLMKIMKSPWSTSFLNSATWSVI